jgi:hypothetical protein
MKKTFIILAFIAAFLALTTEVPAQKNRASDTIVTSTINDIAANSLPFSIHSDLLGDYKNGVDSVVSRIQSIGDWELDMLGSPSRRIFVDFAEPVPNSNPNNLPPPFSNAYVPARFLAQCSSDLRNLLQGGTRNCRLVVAIDYNSVRYSIRFNSVNYPGTGEPLWTCTSVANGKCSGWRMESDPNATGKIIGQLLKVSTRRNTPDQLLGKYYFSFRVDVSNP